MVCSDYRLSFAKYFFRFINTSAVWKAERRSFFLRAESFITDEWVEFYCLHKYSCCFLKKLRGLVLMNAMFVLWITPWFRMSQKLVATIKIAKHALGDCSWLDFSLLGRKNILDINLIPFSHFHFWKELILVGNIPFWTWFFKVRSWWSWRVLIDFIYTFTFSFVKTSVFYVFRRHSAGITEI